ncbi:MAG TPA: hypothetical protein QF626_10900 [Prochlorococcaceae cyanobacterium Fu_MAG_50]|nr:hypothetical protein [Prochlorococcaceae cyanobacterium Fu_MAG_50]
MSMIDDFDLIGDLTGLVVNEGFVQEALAQEALAHSGLVQLALPLKPVCVLVSVFPLSVQFTRQTGF